MRGLSNHLVTMRSQVPKICMMNLKIKDLADGCRLLAYPSLWAPWPILYNPDEVEKPTSWQSLWDTKYQGHVSMIDRPVEPIVITGIMLGVKDPFEMTTDELKMAENKLIEQKPLIRQYFRDTEQLVNLLTSKEVWISMGEGPGIADQVRRNGTPCEAITPTEGTIGWVDGTAIIREQRIKLPASNGLIHSIAGRDIWSSQNTCHMEFQTKKQWKNY